MTNATIYVIDDDPAVRESLALLLEQDNLRVATYASAEAFLTACEDVTPQGCAIVDIRMLGMDGLQLQKELSRRGILLPIVFLTGHGDIPLSVRAIKAGAVDFLTKPIKGSALRESVQAALQEYQAMSERLAENSTAASRIASLTEREREVMSLAIGGLSNKAIARQLNISHRTVEIHKARVMHKTGAATLPDLIRLAEAGGLQSPPPPPSSSERHEEAAERSPE